MVRMRAIEQGLPMVRVANSGISAMIDPYGRMVASMPLNLRATIDVRLPAALGMPFYARFPAFIIYLLVGGILLLVTPYFLSKR
jgi:apolipoprotein N-acyltransferase